MCNLYDIGPSPDREPILWERNLRNALRTLPKSFAIRKTDPAVVIRNSSGELLPATMRWGFHREFNPAINNTRSDKLTGGMWRESFQHRRCVVPIAAFYEWTGGKRDKQTYAIRDTSDSLWAAGVWESHPDIGDSFSIITTESVGWMRKIHNRIPAFLDFDEVPEYLTGECPKALIRPRSDELEHFVCANPLRTKSPAKPFAQDSQAEFLFDESE